MSDEQRDVTALTFDHPDGAVIVMSEHEIQREREKAMDRG